MQRSGSDSKIIVKIVSNKALHDEGKLSKSTTHWKALFEAQRDGRVAKGKWALKSIGGLILRSKRRISRKMIL